MRVERDPNLGAVGEDAATTRDALFDGRLRLVQPERGAGYRVNVDALLLARFAAQSTRTAPKPPARVAFDLGAGVGAVGLTLLHLGAAQRVVFVEVDPEAAKLARGNLHANGWQALGEVVAGDVVEVARSCRGEANLVVCNPPYVPPGRGRVPAQASRARARSGAITGFVQAARLVAGRRARVCFVYPAGEMLSLLAALRGVGLEPKRLRAVHATSESPARVVLVEAQPGKPGGLSVLPPLVERDGQGYTRDLLEVLARQDNA